MFVDECLDDDTEVFFTDDVFNDDDLTDPRDELSLRNSFAELRDLGGEVDLEDTLEDFLLDEPTDELEDFLLSVLAGSLSD